MLYGVCSADGAADIRSSLQYLMTLFSRKLFNDSLPPVVLKHQLYSLHNDKTAVDKQVVRSDCFRPTVVNFFLVEAETRRRWDIFQAEVTLY